MKIVYSKRKSLTVKNKITKINEKNGSTLFNLAVLNSRDHVLSILLHSGIMVSVTSLYLAIKKDDVKIVQIFTKPEFEHIIGDSILQLAINCNSKNTIEFLLKNVKTLKHLRLIDHEGFPALHLSIKSDCSIDIVKILIAFGVDLKERDLMGLTPLHHTARKGNFQLIQLLKMKSRDNILVEKDTNGIYPISWAALYKHSNVFELLFQSGILNESFVFCCERKLSPFFNFFTKKGRIN